ncbi:Fibrinogen C domain-containing protein 1 [Apostichopus japonicus]|uniref:Fibrinogen C domain-containing protein 1 n=1 Tax=Stichopus japonicus TaxID=307972 RepID=A0A2G8KYL1_STIJA|nr:Fibrinogen C domain-containing protein 1 [Apostichopus japonicus]
MRYGYCVSQRICPDPDDSIPCRRNEESCFCPEEFQLNGDECVAPGECDDCFLEGTETEEGVTIEHCVLRFILVVIVKVCNTNELEGNRWVICFSVLFSNCSCVDGNVTCVNYMCSVNAICNATRNNAGQCYCKTGYVGDGTVCRYPKDCLEIFEHDDMAESRVYTIQPNKNRETTLEVFCDDGGWTLIQRRADLDSTVTFNRSWEDYRLGFGLSPNDFWIGNEKLSYLTNQKTYQLRIDMTTSNGSSIHVTYDNFRISDDELSGYKLLSTENCPDPDDSIPCRRNEESCFCPEEFQLNGDECVAPGECDDCFLEGTETEEGVTIESGGSYVYPNCSLNCSCVDGNVTCVSYTCSVDATCKVLNNAGQCHCEEDYVDDGTVCRYPTDCMEIFEHGDMAESRVYTIQPNKNSESTLEVFCDMSDGGGWTVFQRRFNGSQNFALPEQNYSEGFGSLLGEFWLGNENLHTLTNQMQYELKIHFMDKNNTLYEAQYSLFQISNKTEKYALQLGDFIKGNAGDSLTAYSNHQPFLTDLTAAWQAVTVSQSSDSVTSVHTPTQYDYSVQHDEGNGNTDDESVQEFTEFLKPISIGPWWHRQDETMTIECDLNGNYSNMFWFTIPQHIASTGMKIRPTKRKTL